MAVLDEPHDGNPSDKRRASSMDIPLVCFSDNVNDNWTLRDAVRGVQIFGGIGSGKSSGSGKTLALSYLKMGFGGIVLTGKVDETKVWLEYAKKTDRLKDVIIFGELNSEYFKMYPELLQSSYEKQLLFNPLLYEMTRQGDGAGETENIVGLFTAIIKMGNRLGGGGDGTSDDPFWDMALQRCIKSAVDVLKLASKKGKESQYAMTVSNIAKVIRTSPKNKNALTRFLNSGNEERRKWMRESYAIKCLIQAKINVKNASASDKRSYEVAESYFLTDFPSLSEKTRSSITEYFYAFANPFRSGLLADLFAQGSSQEVLPERSFEGKIIILDFPVKKYLQLGVYAQAIYKRLWQQAVERREVNEGTRPVFMWVDEAQYFLNEEDMMFQTTARSSRACTVMISQNISNYYATIGGKYPKERVDSLLGNLATKIFHANNDYVTNEWAANTIGKTYLKQRTVSMGEMQNISFSESLNYQVEPQEFTVLRSGGPYDDFKVEAVITVSGKQWSDGKNYLKTFFRQDIDHGK